jgi:hypothetical protein
MLLGLGLSGFAQSNAVRPKPARVMEGGPAVHRVLSASSADGLNWTRDPGVRLEQASVPCALADGDRVVMYYVDGAKRPATVGCAISADGISFTKQDVHIAGLNGSFAADPSIIRNTSGTYCLYYLEGPGTRKPGPQPGGPKSSEMHEIHLAVGSDPLNLADTGPVLRYPDLVDPDVFGYRGSWFMYVFSQGKTLIATSLTGRDFQVRGSMQPTGFGTVAPVQLADGRLRLYAFNQDQRSGNRFVSFISNDGVNWTAEPGVRLQAAANEMITDPFVISWKGAYQMYFKVEPR